MYVYVWNKNYTGTDTHTHTHAHTHTYTSGGVAASSVFVLYTHDKDYSLYLPAKEGAGDRAWCPPAGREFVPDADNAGGGFVESKAGEMPVSCPTSNRSRCEPVEFGRGRPQGRNNPIGTWRWISSRHATSPGNSPTSARCQQRRPALALPKITRHPPSKHMPVDHVNVLPNFLLVVLAVVEWWWYGWWWLVRI